MSEYTNSTALEGPATAAYHQAQQQVQALHQRLHDLQQMNPFVRTDAEYDEMLRLEKRLPEMEGQLPSLHAAARKERAAINIVALQDDWAPLTEAKQQAYAEMAQLITAMWTKAAELQAIHQQQDDLLQSIPDDEVRRYMTSTFWIDSGTMRTRMAGNMYPPQAWTSFFQDNTNQWPRTGAQIAANDPGVSPLPASVVRNVQSGQLFAERLHRGGVA